MSPFRPARMRRPPRSSPGRRSRTPAAASHPFLAAWPPTRNCSSAAPAPSTPGPTSACSVTHGEGVPRGPACSGTSRRPGQPVGVRVDQGDLTQRQLVAQPREAVDQLLVVSSSRPRQRRVPTSSLKIGSENLVADHVESQVSAPASTGLPLDGRQPQRRPGQREGARVRVRSSPGASRRPPAASRRPAR